MDTPTPLDDATIAARLPAGWTYADGAIERTYRLAGFRAAIAFIGAVADPADAANHHPELSNVYDRVTIRLTTHDAGNRVTAADLDLAAAIEALPRDE